MPLIKSQKAAAEALGITPTALRNWMKEPGFPDCSRGFDLAAIRSWIQSRQRKGSDLGQKLQEIKLAQEGQKLRIAKAKADEMDRRAQIAAGELLPRRGWELFASKILTELGDAADQLPDLLAAICCETCAAKVRDRLQEELDQWRDHATDELQREPDA